MEERYVKQRKAGIYVIVWIILLALTGLTIKADTIRRDDISMLANLLIAAIQASLVLLYFMHIKDEHRLFKLILFVPMITVSIIIGLTFFDIWYRY